MKMRAFVFFFALIVISALVSGKAKHKKKKYGISKHVQTRQGVPPPVSPWAQNIFMKTGKGGKCQQQRSTGRPATGDVSPIKGSWGTPIPDFQNRVTRLQPTAEIGTNYVIDSNVLIGTKDFAFVGTKHEILAFCACFEAVIITGRSLQLGKDDKGRDVEKWVENTGEIKIQLQGASKFKGNESPFEILFKVVLDRITAHLSPVNTIIGVAGDVGIDADILKQAGVMTAQSLGDLKEAFAKIKELLPMEENTLYDFLDTAKTVGSKLKGLLQEMKRDSDKMDLNWKGAEFIKQNERNIVVITMYDKPLNRIRATYNMDKAKATLGEIGQVLQKFFKA